MGLTKGFYRSRGGVALKVPGIWKSFGVGTAGLHPVPSVFVGVLGFRV